MSSTRDFSSSRKIWSTTLVIENLSQMNDDYKQSNFEINGHKSWFGLFPKRTISLFEDENVFVYLHFYLSSTLNYQVSILNDNGEKIYTCEYNWTFDEKRGHHIAKFITRSELLNSANGYLSNDKLTLLWEAQLIGQTQQNTLVEQKDLNQLNCLSKAFESLLSDGKLTDTTLLVGMNAKELQVHKTVLAARSPVFAAMFEHDCEEKRLNNVTITDIDQEACEVLLRYIYTGKVDSLDRYALELFEAADKYQLDLLKDICEDYLHSTLSSESVANVLILADLHQAPNLKAKCIEFISQNIDQVEITDGWKTLENNAKLLRELFFYSAKKK